ncbi:MAG: hypothetical protein AAGA96_10090 [Verrucomicrobiota bacterium]
MDIPHRNATRIALIAFGVIFVGGTGWAFIELRSVIPILVLAVGMLALFQIARVSIHTEIVSDDLVCYRAFSEKSMPLSDLKKIVVDSSDQGTVTLHFSGAKVRLAQRAKTTRSVVSQLLSKNSGVEFSDSEDWYASGTKKSEQAVDLNT